MAESKTVVEVAKARFKRASDAYGELRQQAIEDTKFVLGDSDNNWQWPEDVYTNRAEVGKKPCLTINITAQHCKQIENQIRQNRPTAKIIPVDSNADVKTAEIYGGMLRSIQSYSNADTAHDIGAKHSIYGGEGFWRVLTEYESEMSMDQVIVIRPLVNPQLVFIDPDAIEPDRSDAKWGIIFEDVPRDEAEHEYGKDAEGNQVGLDWGLDGDSGWVTKETIRRAEYFWCEDKEDTLLQLADGTVVLKSAVVGPVQVIDKRPTTIKQWKWARIVGGMEKPEDEKNWPGKYLPIICVVGDETNVNGKIVRKGLVRDLKDSARMVNYSYSAAVETVALQTKSPWIAAGESVEGHEEVWGSSNIENRAFLPWNAFGENGEPLPKPERVQPAAMATAQVQMLQLSVEQARAASGQQNANFGIKSEAQSGVGIQRLKAQGEIATFNFPDNLARALKYEATVVLDLIPKVYDRARIIRIIGLDGAEQKVQLDPSHEGPAQDMKADESGIDAIFNPTAGRYDVAIDTGPSYQTQRQEAADALGELASRAPILMQAAPDLVVKAMDFQGASEIADRLAKTVDPRLKDDGGDQVAQMQGKLQELMQSDQQQKQVITAMQEHIDKLDQEKAGRVLDNQTKLEVERMKQQTTAAAGVADHAIKAFDAETKRLQAMVGSMGPAALKPLVMQTLRDILSGPQLGDDTQQIDQIEPDSDEFVASPPEMAATGAQPGLGEQPTLPEGTPNV